MPRYTMPLIGSRCGICLRDLAMPSGRPLLPCCQAYMDQVLALVVQAIRTDQAIARMTPARDVLHQINIR